MLVPFTVKYETNCVTSRMQISSDWIVSAQTETDIFNEKTIDLAELPMDKVHLLRSCDKISAVIFHRNIITSDTNDIVLKRLVFNDTDRCRSV